MIWVYRYIWNFDFGSADGWNMLSLGLQMKKIISAGQHMENYVRTPPLRRVVLGRRPLQTPTM